MLRDNARYEKVEIKKVEGGASPTRRSAKEERQEEEREGEEEKENEKEGVLIKGCMLAGARRREQAREG